MASILRFSFAGATVASVALLAGACGGSSDGGLFGGGTAGSGTGAAAGSAGTGGTGTGGTGTGGTGGVVDPGWTLGNVCQKLPAALCNSRQQCCQKAFG